MEEDPFDIFIDHSNDIWESITLIESIPGQLSVANRKLDPNNSLDAAILEFLFKFNLKVGGLSDEEIAEKWKQSPWYRKG
jgi:hypothetical protein